MELIVPHKHVVKYTCFMGVSEGTEKEINKHDK
jgi:hypothetical protein